VLTRRDLAEIDLRSYSTAALLERAEALMASAGDPDTPEVIRIHDLELLDVIRKELARRERLSRINAGVASPADRKYEELLKIATLVKERLELSEIFDAGGYHLIPAGTNGRRGCPEWKGACPVCGGDDRMVVWDDGPLGRAWCRQCEWLGDHITVARSLWQLDFEDAVRRLAELANTPVAQVS
jgi:hypothetical protein